MPQHSNLKTCLEHHRAPVLLSEDERVEVQNASGQVVRSWEHDSLDLRRLL